MPPAYLLVPEWDYTLGPAVAELCARADFTPDPEQVLGVDAVFGERAGLPAAFEAFTVAPRQNLKTGMGVQVELGWMFVTSEPGAAWSAHHHKTVRESFELVAGIIESHPFLSRHVVNIKTGGGDEEIILKAAGSSAVRRHFPFITRSNGGGRGRSIGKHIWDEYLYVTRTHEGTLMPTMSTFPDAQRVGMTSAGLATSARARAVRDRGRALDARREPRLFYMEFCDDLPGECARGADCTHLFGTPGCRMDDEARLRRANSAIGRRITLAYVRDERRSLDPEEFGRERLGYWDDPAGADSDRPFAGDVLEPLIDRSSRIVDVPVFALDVAPNRGWSSIVAGGRNADGLLHLETTSHTGADGERLYSHRQGTGWVRQWFASRLDRDDRTTPTYGQMKVLVLAGSAAMALVPALAKMPGLEVVPVAEASWPAACGVMFDAVAGERVVFVGDPEILGAAEGIAKRENPERGFTWSRAESGSDISPWVAATLLAWHFEDGGGSGGFNVW